MKPLLAALRDAARQETAPAVQADAAAYDACAEELFAGMLASLQSVSVPKEEHPARLDWHC